MTRHRDQVDPEEAADRSCPNCEARLHGPHCGHCGQLNAQRRLDARTALREALGNLLNLESGLVRTVVELARNPGLVARQYIQGKRARYANPFRFCLATTALFFVWNELVGGSQLKAVYDFGFGQRQVAARQIGNVIFLTLPLVALVLNLLFRRSRRNLAESYAFVLFLNGELLLFYVVFSLLYFVAPGADLVARTLFRLVVSTWATMVFFEEHGALAVSKALLVHVLYYALVLLLTIPVDLLFRALPR